jgi:hypothetical protein
MTVIKIWMNAKMMKKSELENALSNFVNKLQMNMLKKTKPFPSSLFRDILSQPIGKHTRRGQGQVRRNERAGLGKAGP